MLHWSQQKYTTNSVPSLIQIGNTKNWRYEFNGLYGLNYVTRFLVLSINKLDSYAF
jgi:hypothetical protein